MSAELNPITDLTNQIKEETAIMRVSREAVSLCDRVKALMVVDQATYDQAADAYNALLEMEKEINKAHDPVISHWHGLHKAALEEKAKDAKPVALSKVLAKRKATDWETEQELIRQKEDRKRQEAAQAKEEADRLALAVQAEQMQAPPEVVEEILSTPLPVTYTTAAPTYQRAKVSSRTNYSCRIINLPLLIKSAAADPRLLWTIMADESALNADARNKKTLFKVPGCELVTTIV